ncbi:MAG: glycine zipper 2TM domain-containing protein [Deltaproteobacteria bacterium]|nr:glycine zipper 2TM domain-containing protein [Deltaproteobacteria bacterium]
MAGCASSRSGEVYSRNQARQVNKVFYGTVLKVSHVQIEGTQSGIGMLGGAIVGGILGSMIGQGHGSTLAAVGGAVGGAVVGSAGEEAITKKNGLEITVELDDGEILAIVQEADAEYFVGDKVRVLRASDGSARVRP